MMKLLNYCLKILLYIPLLKDGAVWLDSRLNRKTPGVSEWLAELLPHRENKNTPWAESVVPLNRSKVALICTAGLFVKDKEPFRESKFGGDFSYRLLPRDLELSRLGAAKLLTDHRLTLMDPNIVFPIDRLKELKNSGVIQEVAESHYSFLGFCSDQGPLAGGSAKEVARKLRYEGVDKVIVISASFLSQETAVIVQRAIEREEIPTVSLIYSAEIAKKMRPPRSCILDRPSLCQRDEYLDQTAQTNLLQTLLRQFDEVKKSGNWTRIS